ncbi:MAG: hypothetical protein RIE59_09340, partial [Imperialibacter sp.]
MKRKFLLPFAFVLLIGCTGSEPDKASPETKPDGLQEFSTVMGYLNKLGQSVDTATMMIDDNMAAKSNLDDLAQKLFGGLKLCDCMQHYTGQAHTHSK